MFVTLRPSLLLLSLFAVGALAGPRETDEKNQSTAVLLDLDAIIEKLQANSPLPELSVSIYRILSNDREEETTPRLTGETAAPREVTSLMPLPPSAKLAIATETAKIRTTGNADADQAMNRLIAQAQKMAAQAYLHRLLHSAAAPDSPDADFALVNNFLDRLKNLDDGVFHPLNQEFIVHWSLVQYENELKRTMRLEMERGKSFEAKLKVPHFRHVLNLIDPMTRKKVWEVSSKPATYKSLFFGVHEKIQSEMGREYLPEYLPSFTSEDFPLALSYINRSLRELEMVALVVNWCLANARSVKDLIDLFHNELWDITFVRYQSRALEDKKANPFLEGKHTGGEAAEQFFQQVFQVVLVKAESDFKISHGTFLTRFFYKLLQKKTADAPFEMETLLYHLEFLMSAEGIDLAGLQQALTYLDRRLATNPPSLYEVSAVSMRERIAYLQEEIYIRQRGWFPPSPKAFQEAMELLREEAIGRQEKNPRKFSPREISATRRFINDVPTEMVVSLKELLDEDEAALLHLPTFQNISTCYEAIAKAWRDMNERRPQ